MGVSTLAVRMPVWYMNKPSISTVLVLGRTQVEGVLKQISTVPGTIPEHVTGDWRKLYSEGLCHHFLFTN
jgi:hypothetical protein